MLSTIKKSPGNFLTDAEHITVPFTAREDRCVVEVVKYRAMRAMTFTSHDAIGI